MTKLYMSVLIGFVLSLSLGLSAWGLVRIADLPKEYVLKEDFNAFRGENRSEHKEIMEILRKLERK